MPEAVTTIKSTREAIAQYYPVRQNIRNSELSPTIYLPFIISLPSRTFINPNADTKSMGYATASQPQAHVEDFARNSLGPSRPVAGARRRWFDSDPDRSPRPQRREFSQFWCHETSVRSPARGEGPTLYGGACQSRAGWARLCSAEDCRCDDRLSPSSWVDRRSHQVLPAFAFAGQAITWGETSMVADLRLIW
jgi:hypothetical protein